MTRRLTILCLTSALALGGCGPEPAPETWDPGALEEGLPQVVAALFDQDPDRALARIASLRSSGTAPAGIEHFEGLALSDAGRPVEALEAFEREIAARPGNGQAHMLAADLLITQGRLAEAREHLARATEHEADPVYTSLLRGRLALLAGDDELARRAFQDYLVGDRYSPRAAEAHYALAQIATRQGRSTEARQHQATSSKLEEVAQYRSLYAERLAADPTDAEATLAIGMTYLDLFNGMGFDPDMARQADVAFSASLALDPENLRALLNLAYLRSVDEDFDEAVALLERALTLDPSYAPAHLSRGHVARRTRDLPLAVEAFAAAALYTEDEVERARALYEQAVTEEELGRVADAVEHYEIVLALQPDAPPEVLQRVQALRQQLEDHR